MTAQEFVQYMTPSSLVDVIQSNWLNHNQMPTGVISVLKICWMELVGNVGDDDAIELIGSSLGDSVVAFLEVVS